MPIAQLNVQSARLLPCTQQLNWELYKFSLINWWQEETEIPEEVNAWAGHYRVPNAQKSPFGNCGVAKRSSVPLNQRVINKHDSTLNNAAIFPMTKLGIQQTTAGHKPSGAEVGMKASQIARVTFKHKHRLL